uniref:Uncharacterized protein n=1 Tax=Anguilla anguilla TaxID=7936 RepID=A0A0E9P6X7_ANGAN
MLTGDCGIRCASNVLSSVVNPGYSACQQVCVCVCVCVSYTC